MDNHCSAACLTVLCPFLPQPVALSSLVEKYALQLEQSNEEMEKLMESLSQAQLKNVDLEKEIKEVNALRRSERQHLLNTRQVLVFFSFAVALFSLLSSPSNRLLLALCCSFFGGEVGYIAQHFLVSYFVFVLQEFEHEVEKVCALKAERAKLQEEVSSSVKHQRQVEAELIDRKR